MTKKKVAIINSFYFPNEVGGAERSVRFIAENLVKNNIITYVICSGRENKVFRLYGVLVIQLKVFNIYNPLDREDKGVLLKLIWHSIDRINLFSSLYVIKILRRLAPDIIHINNQSCFSPLIPFLSKILISRKIKIIQTLRDYYSLCINSSMVEKGSPCQSRCIKCKLLTYPNKITSKFVDVVVGNSYSTLEHHLINGYYKNAKKEVIYNGYDRNDNSSIHEIIAEKSKNITESKKVTFGYLGRICPTKGLDYLVNEFVSSKSKNISLIIAGEGLTSEIEKIELADKLNNNIAYIGRSNPDLFFKMIDILIVPSIWEEPLPRVAFEAFSWGVPVLASSCGGTKELIENNKNGFVFDIKEGHLKDLIEKFANNELNINSFALNAYNCSGKFKMNHVIDNYLNAYDK